MRRACIDMVHKLARRDDRVVFIGSDLSPGLLAEMKAEAITANVQNLTHTTL